MGYGGGDGVKEEEGVKGEMVGERMEGMEGEEGVEE